MATCGPITNVADLLASLFACFLASLFLCGILLVDVIVHVSNACSTGHFYTFRFGDDIMVLARDNVSKLRHYIS